MNIKNLMFPSQSSALVKTPNDYTNPNTPELIKTFIVLNKVCEWGSTPLVWATVMEPAMMEMIHIIRLNSIEKFNEAMIVNPTGENFFTLCKLLHEVINEAYFNPIHVGKKIRYQYVNGHDGRDDYYVMYVYLDIKNK